MSVHDLGAIIPAGARKEKYKSSSYHSTHEDKDYGSHIPPVEEAEYEEQKRRIAAQKKQEEQKEKERKEIDKKLKNICARPLGGRAEVKFDHPYSPDAHFYGKILLDKKSKHMAKKADYIYNGMNFYNLVDPTDSQKKWFVYIPPMVTKNTVPGMDGNCFDYTVKSKTDNVALGGTVPISKHGNLGEDFPEIYMDRDEYQKSDVVVLRLVETDITTGKPKIAEKNLPQVDFYYFYVSNPDLSKLVRFTSGATMINNDGTLTKLSGQLYDLESGERLENRESKSV